MEYLVKSEEGYFMTREVSIAIAQCEKMAKEIEQRQKAIREAILKEMEEANIMKVETEDLTITYIPQTFRESFNGKKFREEYSALYDEYVEIKEVKPSIRMKVR